MQRAVLLVLLVEEQSPLISGQMFTRIVAQIPLGAPSSCPQSLPTESVLVEEREREKES